MFVQQLSPAGILVFITDTVHFATELTIAGGAMAFQWNDACQAIEDEHQIGFGKIENDTPVIMISRFINETTSTNELNALIAHEEAHHIFGHIDFYMKSVEAGIFGVMSKPEFELEADAHSAKLYGNEVISSALSKIVRSSIANPKILVMMGIHVRNSHEFHDVRRNAMRQLKYRFDALRSM